MQCHSPPAAPCHSIHITHFPMHCLPPVHKMLLSFMSVILQFNTSPLIRRAANMGRCNWYEIWCISNKTTVSSLQLQSVRLLAHFHDFLLAFFSILHLSCMLLSEWKIISLSTTPINVLELKINQPIYNKNTSNKESDQVCNHTEELLMQVCANRP